LCWRQHGGSGLGLTWREALDLDTGERDWLLERIDEQRSREAEALRKAARRR
jgi:hypothetical protein